MWVRGQELVTKLMQTANAQRGERGGGVSLAGITLSDERGTTQTTG